MANPREQGGLLKSANVHSWESRGSENSNGELLFALSTGFNLIMTGTMFNEKVTRSWCRKWTIKPLAGLVSSRLGTHLLGKTSRLVLPKSYLVAKKDQANQRVLQIRITRANVATYKDSGAESGRANLCFRPPPPIIVFKICNFIILSLNPTSSLITQCSWGHKSQGIGNCTISRWRITYITGCLVLLGN